MGRTKGGKNRTWSADEKLRIIRRYLNNEGNLSEIAKQESISSGMLSNWVKRFDVEGIEGLNNKVKNPFAGFHSKKNPTKLEKLEYENFRLKMENEMLKKGLDPERVVNLAKQKKD